MIGLLRVWYSFEYRYNMVSAYLAANMGEHDLASVFECQAYNAKRRMDVLEIQG